ncbi:glycosyltransferase family 8 protein [Pectobacterium zantedeschiae]|uniref:Glycosyl transferase n=1 Tax=Pectobacterium zantedeschiae TaxID=2034769 RepID=A0A9X8P5T5_9GAMM|nr:glycosyltransferase [Pectobacterium zantedeschiae]RYC44799.1 glycosyl transferase [Pectobacterium zantedeschiae]RYC49952.1 glycosyl transferase [Pectobacterium zantedeschiae]
MEQQGQDLLIPHDSLLPHPPENIRIESVIHPVKEHYSSTQPLQDIHSEVFKILLNRHDAKEVIEIIRQRMPELTLAHVSAHYLQLCLMYGADRGVANLFQKIRMRYNRNTHNDLVNVATRLINTSFMDEANTIILHLSEFASRHPAQRILRLKYLFALEQLDELSSVFKDIPLKDYQTSDELLALRIKYDCVMGNPVAGLEWLIALSPLNTLPPLLLRWAVDCMTTLERYEEAIPLLEASLSLDFSYQRDTKRVLRVAEKTGETPRLVQTIEHLHGWFTSPDLVRLRTTLLQAYTTSYPVQTNVPLPTGNSQTFGDVPLSLVPPLSEYAIFFCTDAAFSLPTVVALTSLAMSIDCAKNPPDIYIFVPPEIHPRWERIADRFSATFQAITLRIVSTLQMELDEKRAHFGFYSAGEKLSTAAYARFYASRYLHHIGVARALYLDSDIVILHSPLSLLYEDMQGFPLAARTDRNSPLIKRAIRLHRIANKRYFNAGVLLFDLTHPATISNINTAITYSEQGDSSLLFLDQCALNKAISGLYLALDERYNRFMPPSSPTQMTVDDTIIVHFIEAPKPWQAGYAGQGLKLWNEYQRHALRIVGDELFCFTPPRPSAKEDGF